MKKVLILLVASMLIGAVQVGTEYVLHATDRIVWELDGENVYILRAEKSEVMCEYCTAPVDKHELCIEQWGWILQGGGDGIYVWESKGTICLEKQWQSSWGFNEVPTLNISGFHEVNIDAGWVNIDSEFGTIIDGEEAKTIFLPAIQR